MKKTLTIIAFSIIIISCDFLKSKDTLLIGTEWMLTTKDVISGSTHTRYSKYSKPLLEDTLYLDFKKNNVLNVSINSKKEVYTWIWYKKDENIIKIDGLGNLKGNYKVGDNISSDFLFLSKKNENVYDDMKMFSFIPKKR